MTCDNFSGCMYAGSTFQVAAYCLQADGSAVNLAGYSATLKLKKPGAEWSEAVLTLTSSPAAGVVITASTGRIDFTISSAQSAALEGVYDLKSEATSSGGVVERILSGPHTVYQ